MNGNDIARLAAAINLLRPDWPTNSLHTFIANELDNRPYRDAAVALAYVATDPDTETPRRVLANGPWWKVGAMKPDDFGSRIIVKARCDDCGGMHGPDAPHLERKPANPKAAEARALLASQKSNLCHCCRVKPTLCPNRQEKSA